MADEEKRTKISVTINHQSYTIVGTESKSMLRRLPI